MVPMRKIYINFAENYSKISFQIFTTIQNFFKVSLKFLSKCLIISSNFFLKLIFFFFSNQIL